MPAATIIERFHTYLSRFDELTARAHRHFEHADWAAAREDSVSRLALYGEGIRALVDDLRAMLGRRLEDRDAWSELRSEYRALIDGEANQELAETWFNSVTRKVFDTVGVDQAIEFVVREPDAGRVPEPSLALTAWDVGGDLAAAVAGLVEAVGFGAPFIDLVADSEAVAGRVEGFLGGTAPATIEVISAPFFREQAAYVIGRTIGADGIHHPMVLAIRNPDGRLQIDAVLLEEDEVSILFSFTRAYFQVQTERPAALIAFLERLMPRKRVAELYTSLGFNKHGKTELYRDLLAHVRSTDQRFTVSRGAVGLVMIVFDMDDYDIVLKIIRDRFPPPKTTTRNAIMERYQLVFEHDRAGRLVEAHEFEHLSLRQSRFEPELLDILADEARRTVEFSGERLVISHAYLERKVTPLNVYIREESEERVRDAIVAYGRCIKDLMASDIFPGDMLMKNFGVTRHGRVVFYDYDELGRITECRFRPIPVSDDPGDEMAETPWFGVREGDIFPEEFPRFMGLTPDLMALFRHHHGDLFDHRTWNGVRARLLEGERIEIFPYGPEQRLPGR